jgi:L-alanine-DL-glutamate epimerase-like enolase superfamily enzyme
MSAKEWTLPLRAPFKIAKRTAYDAQNALVTLTSEDGTFGHGAAAPAAYVTGETVESVIAAVNAAGNALHDLDGSRIGPLLDRIAALFPDAPATRASVEMAALDLWGRHHRLNLWHHFGARKSSVTTDLTIPIVGPDRASDLASNALSEGFTHFKIKVGGTDGHEADFERIRAIAKAAPQAGLRIDANQAFTPDAAVRFANDLLEISPHVELLEQPVSQDDTAGLKYVRDRVSIPIFADEAAQTPASVRRLIREGAVDGVNIKLMKSGIVGALEIIALCRTAGVKLMIGCMLESRLSLTAGVYLAAGTDAIPTVDLDAHLLLKPDPDRFGGFTEEGPRMRICTNGYGWGVEGLAEL